MDSIKLYAQEVFREISKRKSNKKFEVFLNEFNKLVKEFYDNNKINCPVSNNCSSNGCYRYFICDFKE